MGDTGGQPPALFWCVCQNFFQDISVKFSAALQFLTSLADNTKFLFIIVHNVDCLWNLADSSQCRVSVESGRQFTMQSVCGIWQTVHSVECLRILADSSQRRVSVKSGKQCRISVDSGAQGRVSVEFSEYNAYWLIQMVQGVWWRQSNFFLL